MALMKNILTFILLLLAVIGTQAQEKPLSIEKIYSSGVIHTKGLRMMKWMKDGESYSSIENNVETNNPEIVRYDAQTNVRTVLVPADWLTDDDGNALRLQDYSWSGDNQKMLLYYNAQRVWRYPTQIGRASCRERV